LTLPELQNLPARRAQSEATLSKMRERFAEAKTRIAELTNAPATPEGAVEVASLRRELAQLQQNIRAARIDWLSRRHADAATTAQIAASHAACCAAELERLTGQA
jgi:chromosome segregation ATPase